MDEAEEYNLEPVLECDSNMFKLEQSSRPLSPKLLLMADLAKMHHNQDTMVMPFPGYGSVHPNTPKERQLVPSEGWKNGQKPEII